VDFDALLGLRALCRLAVDCGAGGDSAEAPSAPGGARPAVVLGADAAGRLSAALVGLPRPLESLRLEALDPPLAAPLLDAALQDGGHVRQVAFRHCALPDTAVARLCRALTGGGAQLQAVRFEECELSDLAEQQLLLALEQCDGRCVVTVDGGTTRHGGPGDRAEWSLPVPAPRCGEAAAAACDDRGGRDAEIEELRATVAAREARIQELECQLRTQTAERDARIRELESRLALLEGSGRGDGQESATAAPEPCDETPPVGGPRSHAAPASSGGLAAVPPMQGLFAMGLLRLQEERAVYARDRPQGHAAEVLGGSTGDSAAWLGEAWAESAAAEEAVPPAAGGGCAGRSRFGFALDSTQ